MTTWPDHGDCRGRSPNRSAESFRRHLQCERCKRIIPRLTISDRREAGPGGQTRSPRNSWSCRRSCSRREDLNLRPLGPEPISATLSRRTSAELARGRLRRIRGVRRVRNNAGHTGRGHSKSTTVKAGARCVRTPPSGGRCESRPRHVYQGHLGRGPPKGPHQILRPPPLTPALRSIASRPIPFFASSAGIPGRRRKDGWEAASRSGLCFSCRKCDVCVPR